MFRDKIDRALQSLWKGVAGQVKVMPETSLIGFDGYRKVVAMKELDIMLLAIKRISSTTREGGYIEGDKPYRYQGRPPSGLVTEHSRLIKSIREHEPINEFRRLAKSTLKLIMGWFAAYTGWWITRDWVLNKSERDLCPMKLELGPLPVAPVAFPG